jgi:flagellar hook protein FlgE
MPFNTGLSGLNAATADLRTTGNNVANAGTVGFKQSRAEFADVFPPAFGGVNQTAIGGGVRLAAVTQQFSQGNIDFTGNNLDLALNGQGFFVLSDAGSQVYSRAGAFQVNRDDFVVNAQGQRLQVYPAQDKDGTRFNTGALTDLKLSTGVAPPKASELVTGTLNLSSEADVIDPAIAFDITDPGTYNNSTSLTLYDSLGEAHTATLYFRKTDAREWDSYLAIDGGLVGDSRPLQFDAKGSLVDPATGRFDFGGTFQPVNGADPLDLTFDMGATTQFGSPFNVSKLSQDGFTTGRLSGVDIDASGVVFARFTNGESLSLGKVALANFPNPQGLQQLGDSTWGSSFAAGEVVLGEADAGDFGLIQSGGLEGSNVDIAEQLVNLIAAQRNYQANAQVISTADTIAQTIINIR